ncbi:MAG: phage tail protein [Lachnospiraceae bacterium]|nr:phage tail protein [Lachnospiraceae bacterium]MBP3875798.1 phage tail protein [Lachnospiraceae bacterium]
MKPILYPAGETQFRSNGLGRLAEATKCLVTEERNGQYELEMQYPITGRHYKEIVEERIIAAKHDDTDDVQPFRIYKITRPMNGIVTVSARHISYQLSKVAVMPFAADTCAEALAGMIANSVGDCPFTIWTDKLLEAHFHVDVPSSFRSLLGGVSGSILDIYGPGEYEWDKFVVKFHAHRGSDQNVYIRYGKNMTDVKKTTDTSNIWTGILPYWAGTDEAEQAVLVTLPEKVIYSDFVDDYVYRMVVPVDLSFAFQEQPTEEQLRTRARAYVRANAADGIPASIDVSFVALWQTEEYKNWAPLQKLKLCDTVTVYHKGLGIENKAKIVSVTYDVILERYEKMTIGEVKTNLGDSIRQISEEIKREVPTNASVSQAISLATNILSGSTGGNIVINTNAKGQPVEILAMDTDSIQTARKIIKVDKDGISVSKAGYSGAFTVLLDMDGKLDAGILKEIIDAALIKKGVLSDKQSNVTWNMATGAFAGKKITITNLTATDVNAESVTADEVSSGDGYTGSCHVDGATITFRAGIVTGKTDDEPAEPMQTFTGTYHVDGATVTVTDGVITAVTPDSEPDPEEETPGGEEGENS